MMYGANTHDKWEIPMINGANIHDKWAESRKLLRNLTNLGRSDAYLLLR